MDATPSPPGHISPLAVRTISARQLQALVRQQLASPRVGSAKPREEARAADKELPASATAVHFIQNGSDWLMAHDATKRCRHLSTLSALPCRLEQAGRR